MFLKDVRLESKKLRDTCRDKPCQLMLAEHCSGEATSVPCHNKPRGWGAMGSKPSDIFICDGCHACHDILDGRVKSTRYTDAEIRLIGFEAMFRKQQEWINLGMIDIS